MILMMFVNATSSSVIDRHKIEDMCSYRIGSSAVSERHLDAVHEMAEEEALEGVKEISSETAA